MTREDIIALAREAGMEQDGDNFFSPGHEEIDVHITDLERFAKLVRDDYSNKHANLWLDRCHKFMLDEREACAVIAEIPISGEQDDITMRAKDRIAAAIRARGETK